MPAVIFTIFTVGLEECDEAAKGYEKSELLKVCQLFLTANENSVIDDIHSHITTRKSQQGFNLILTHFMPLITLVVYGIVAILASGCGKIKSLIHWVREKIQAERFIYQVSEELIDKAVFLMRDGLLENIENRYFDISESRRGTTEDLSYEGPHDEYFSKADDVSSIKVSDRYMTAMDDRRQKTHKKVDEVIKMVSSLKKSELTHLAAYDVSARPTRRSTFFGFQTSEFDRVPVYEDVQRMKGDYCSIIETRATSENAF